MFSRKNTLNITNHPFKATTLCTAIFKVTENEEQNAGWYRIEDMFKFIFLFQKTADTLSDCNEIYYVRNIKKANINKRENSSST